MRFSHEMMTLFRAYAADLAPTPNPEYRVLHDWAPRIQVPAGYLPIRIAQFCRGDHQMSGRNLRHWAIFIPTSSQRGVGNFYEVEGNLQNGYFLKHVVNARHPWWDPCERGSHLVGYVAPSYLQTLETHLSLTQVWQGREDWNCQNWVVEALEGLDHPQMYAVQMNHQQWVEQMEILEEAWDIGDA